MTINGPKLTAADILALALTGSMKIKAYIEYVPRRELCVIRSVQTERRLEVFEMFTPTEVEHYIAENDPEKYEITHTEIKHV